ncbi:MAG: hypothetical protein M5U28_18870 [Sandaracinaceae bacterium]|nr:hypothetical protein [Sandaracinaceae bacterium]
MSNKGRYVTEGDLAAGYAEPWQRADQSGMMRALSLTSLYPPRRDVTGCGSVGCGDHDDVGRFAFDARTALPGSTPSPWPRRPASSRRTSSSTCPRTGPTASTPPTSRSTSRATTTPTTTTARTRRRRRPRASGTTGRSTTATRIAASPRWCTASPS